MEENRISISPDDRERSVTLDALRQAAADNGGQPPGEKEFRSSTGISPAAWQGKHWIRWSDVIRDAGYAGAGRFAMRNDELMLTRLAEIVRHFGKIPTSRAIYFYARRHPGTPSHSTFIARFGNHRTLVERLRCWVTRRPEMEDVARFCQQARQPSLPPAACEPMVYLLRGGEYFKIGWAKTLDKRIRDIQSCFPERLELVHAIPAQDPVGTEAQWHSRFKDKRVRGEWFKLTLEDVEEFRSAGSEQPPPPAPA